MIIAPKPENEAARLKSLEKYKILDTLTEQTFNDIVELATSICGTKVGLISLIDADRQWFKAAKGVDIAETSRDIAFCTHAILQDKVMIVPDASKDERFHDNPLVSDGLKIRFYAGAPLQTSDGHMLGTLCVVDPAVMNLNSYQTKALEALSRQVMCLLELRLNVTNLAEASEELEASRDQALRMSESKSAFLANVTHEIRTPINGIIGMTDFLKGSDLNAEQKEYLNSVETSAKSLLCLVNDILDSSKIEAGKLSLENKNFDLDKTISDIETVFKFETKRKNIQLSVKKSCLNKTVKGDSLRIRQILLNFMSNAVKFTSQGTVSLRVVVLHEEFEKTKIRFEVCDSGIGISSKKIESLFQDYAQADDTIARNYGGTGLGLSISRKLVNLMHGEIGVESEPDQGSTFWFEVEFENGTELADANKVTINAPSKMLAHFTKSEAARYRVLAVDDNQTNRIILSRSLTQLGFQVRLASDGKEAVEILALEHFDIVLMDIQMPVMDGFEATRQIRRSENANANIPILATTANVADEVKEESRKVGMDDFLSKPFTKEKILSKLAKPDVKKAN